MQDWSNTIWSRNLLQVFFRVSTHPWQKALDFFGSSLHTAPLNHSCGALWLLPQIVQLQSCFPKLQVLTSEPFRPGRTRSSLGQGNPQAQAWSRMTAQCKARSGSRPGRSQAPAQPSPSFGTTCPHLRCRKPWPQQRAPRMGSEQGTRRDTQGESKQKQAWLLNTLNWMIFVLACVAHKTMLGTHCAEDAISRATLRLTCMHPCHDLSSANGWIGPTWNCTLGLDETSTIELFLQAGIIMSERICTALHDTMEESCVVHGVELHIAILWFNRSQGKISKIASLPRLICLTDQHLEISYKGKLMLIWSQKVTALRLNCGSTPTRHGQHPFCQIFFRAVAELCAASFCNQYEYHVVSCVVSWSFPPQT